LKEVTSSNESISSNITLHNEGIAGSSGKRSFFHNPDSSIASSMVFSGETTKETTIECATVKEIVSQNKIKSIDIFKIDAEGSEYEIFYHMVSSMFVLKFSHGNK
jgi:FkbM family methyltransferase